jgi:hypothetical protein
VVSSWSSFESAINQQGLGLLKQLATVSDLVTVRYYSLDKRAVNLRTKKVVRFSMELRFFLPEYFWTLGLQPVGYSRRFVARNLPGHCADKLAQSVPQAPLEHRGSVHDVGFRPRIAWAFGRAEVSQNERRR